MRTGRWSHLRWDKAKLNIQAGGDKAGRATVMNAPCPICKKVVSWEGNAFRPFCSERCQLVDLSSWLGERYRVPDDADDVTREWQTSLSSPDDKEKFPEE